MTDHRALEHKWAAIQKKERVKEVERKTVQPGNGKKNAKARSSGKIATESGLGAIGGSGSGGGEEPSAVVVMVVGAGRGPLVKATIT